MKFLHVVVFLATTSFAMGSQESKFFTEKIKNVINLLFNQTAFGIVNIPLFNDVTLTKFVVEELDYSFEQYHKLAAQITVEGDVLGIIIDNSVSLAIEF